MRVCAVILFLVFAAFPASLFAQRDSATGSDASGVENVSEQGGFIGSGIPSAFIGVDEVYNSSSRSSTSARGRATSTVPRRTTAARSPARTTAAASRRPLSNTNSSNQTVRSVVSLDFDTNLPLLSRQRQAAIEGSLTRIRGIQDGQVAYKDSPMGTTAVLTGTVATDAERRVAKQLLLLEPGIDHVENLLEVR